MVSVSHPRFQRRSHNSASPLATHRLPWGGYPAFYRYYGDAKTASVHFYTLITISIPWGCSLFSLPARREPAGSPGPCYAGLVHFRPLPQGDSRLSQLPERPPFRFAVLSDPGRTSMPNHSGTSVLPPLFQARRLPQSFPFRGSITRLYGSRRDYLLIVLGMPTLEDAISDANPGCFRWLVRPSRAGLAPTGSR